MSEAGKQVATCNGLAWQWHYRLPHLVVPSEGAGEAARSKHETRQAHEDCRPKHDRLNLQAAKDTGDGYGKKVRCDQHLGHSRTHRVVVKCCEDSSIDCGALRQVLRVEEPGLLDPRASVLCLQRQDVRLDGDVQGVRGALGVVLRDDEIAIAVREVGVVLDLRDTQEEHEEQCRHERYSSGLRPSRT